MSNINAINKRLREIKDEEQRKKWLNKVEKLGLKNI